MYIFTFYSCCISWGGRHVLLVSVNSNSFIVLLKMHVALTIGLSNILSLLNFFIMSLANVFN